MSLAANKRKNHRSKSLSPSPINPYNQRTCKFHHGNKKIDTCSTTFECKDCKSKIRRYGIVYGCLRCKFYLCQPCFRKPSCQNGHLLKGTHVKRNTVCSVCKYKSKKQRLQMYQCNLCKFNMCLGCYSYETCSGNHGLKWIKIKQSTDKSMISCHKCHRIFKINKSLFMCKKCKYALCGDCYQPSLTLKSKIHRQEKINQKIKSDQQKKHRNDRIGSHNVNVNNDNDGQEHKANDFDESRSSLFEEEKKENEINFTDDEDDIENEHEEEEKNIVLTDDHLEHHNNNYNYNYANVYGPAHGYTQSYHSYSHSNSHHSTSKNSHNTSRSKSRERAKSKKKKSNKKDNKKENTKASSKKKKKKKKSQSKSKPAQLNNGNTPSLSLSATSSANMPYNDQELSSSLDLCGMESCAPSEMTRIPSILTDCIICMERDKDVAFLPCGHYIACDKCAKLLKNDTGMCAICSMKIQSILRIYE